MKVLLMGGTGFVAEGLDDYRASKAAVEALRPRDRPPRWLSLSEPLKG